MICTTSRSQILIKASFKSNLNVLPFDKILSLLALDPGTGDEKRHCFVISSNDIPNKKVRKKFEDAVMAKHPDNKIIYVCRNKQHDYPEGLKGLNYNFLNPTPAEVVKAVADIFSKESMAAVHGLEKEEEGGIAKLEYIDNETTTEPAYTELKEEKELPPVPSVEPAVEEVPVAPAVAESPAVEHKEEVAVEDSSVTERVAESTTTIRPTDEFKPDTTDVDLAKTDLDQRMKRLYSTAEVTDMMQTANMDVIIADLMKSNITFSQVENRVSALSREIQDIMLQSSQYSLEQRLKKINSLVMDRATFNGAGISVIEKQIENIIDTVVHVCMESVPKRVDELVASIKNVDPLKSPNDFVYLSALKETRMNAIYELGVIIGELDNICADLHRLVGDAAIEFHKRETNITGNENINNDIRARYAVVLSDNSVAIIQNMYQKLLEVPDQFETLSRILKSALNLVYAVLNADEQIIQALQKMNDRIIANNIESTQYALITKGKSMRLFIGADNSGRTVIPYLYSKHKSLQNNNVLMLHLAGDDNLDAYNVPTISVEDFMLEPTYDRFVVVRGVLSETVNVQDIYNLILRVAPFYPVINIVCDYGQKELIEVLTDKCLSINYMLNPTVTKLDDVVEAISSTEGIDCLKYLVVNGDCHAMPMIFGKLNISESYDIQAVNFPTTNELVTASLTGNDPYEFYRVKEIMGGLNKYV